MIGQGQDNGARKLVETDDEYECDHEKEDAAVYGTGVEKKLKNQT